MNNRIFELIYNNGPRLRPEMSRMTYDTYVEYYKPKILEEQLNMKLFQDHYSYAVPSKKAILQLKNYIGNDSVLELNAHLGLWSYLLSNELVNIVPTTETLPKYNPFMQIENINYLDALQKYSDRQTLLFVCPNFKFKDYTIDNILDAFTGSRIILICEEKNVNRLVNHITGGTKYILSRLNKLKYGEPYELKNQWILTNEITIPQWLNYNYKIYIIEKF